MVGSSRVVSRVSLGVVFLFGCLCFLFFGIVSHQVTSLATITVPSTGSFKHLKWKQRQEAGHRRDVDLNYVSKRRVPNGPDPIHNSLVTRLKKLKNFLLGASASHTKKYTNLEKD